MARNKQTGPEIKLYQIDTMVYLTEKNIITKLAMFSEFIKNGGVAVADSLKLNRAKALERYDRNYKISDIQNMSSIDGQATETWLRKNGFLNSKGGKYELSSVARAIIENKITLSEYCFLILTKQWIRVKELGRKEEYKENLLALILSELLSKDKIAANEFVSLICSIVLDTYREEYVDLALSNQEAARFLIEPLLISKVMVESNEYYFVPDELKDLALDYIENSKSIRKIDEVDCTDEEYWNTFQFGIYDLINESNKELYKKYYPQLFCMKNRQDVKDNHSLQQIFYGAPGTGKSHKIKEDANVKKADEKNLVFRTTFHPDSDYSTFVGSYKPTMDDVYAKVVPVVLGESGTVFNKNEGTYTEKRIVYQFVPQAFLQAYIAAWNNIEENVYLVIEEINRGNCAQIFGDLFQLLDRDDDGYSEYPIKADRDLARYLIDGKDEKGEDVLANKDGIKEGKLKLPKNLYIWATMNTSDQSLFPIDSAFKRRWDWKYMPIENAEKGWKIKINGNEYDWYQFLDAINKEVLVLTHSEDKQLGYFFAKAKDGVIDAETLVNKVYFYLWTDVFKDYDYESQKAFRKPNSNEPIAFKEFFEKGKLNEVMAEQVLVNLGLEKLNKPQDLFE